MPERFITPKAAAVWLIWMALFTAGCGGEKSGDPRTHSTNPIRKTGRKVSSVHTTARFVERGNVSFTYRNGEEADHAAILESLGGGLAAFDYDRDGDLDLCVAGGGGYQNENEIVGLPLGLFRNDGDWHFTDVTESAGVQKPGHYSHGIAAADYDGDGFPDFVVTGYGGLTLYRNNQDGTFSSIDDAGLDDRLWSSSAAWGDLNLDGFLDLYVAHYVDWSWSNNPLCREPEKLRREICSPKDFSPLPDTLYFSRGEGTFRDGTKEAGLQSGGKGLGVVIADINLDGRCDVYVGNDTVPNYLYKNTPSGRLDDISLESGTSVDEDGGANGSMGVDVCDYNLDGRPDVWVANYQNESFALYRNDGGMQFQPSSRITGITATGQLYVGWGTAFFDFDRDGDEDVFVANGHVIRFPTAAPIRQQPILFENLEGKRFANVADAAGDYLKRSHNGRGVALGDFNRDHRLDLAVSHLNDPVALLSNETPTKNDWLEIRLVGTQSNRDAIGGRAGIEVNGKTYWRQVKGGGSYASTNTNTLHFGIPAGETIGTITVHWPDGKREEWDSLQSNSGWMIVEGRAPLRMP